AIDRDAETEPEDAEPRRRPLGIDGRERGADRFPIEMRAEPREESQRHHHADDDGPEVAARFWRCRDSARQGFLLGPFSSSTLSRRESGPWNSMGTSTLRMESSPTPA